MRFGFRYWRNISILQIQKFDQVIKFIYVENVLKGLLPINFSKIVPGEYCK